MKPWERKRVVLAIGLGLVLLFGWAVFAWSTRPAALVYQGKTVRSWSWQYYVWPSGLGREEAASALLRMGDRAVPDLVRQLQAKDSSLRKFYWKASAKAPRALRVALLKNVRPPFSMTERAASAHALGLLGPLAEPATKSLAAAIADPDKGVRSEACLALGRIGAPAVPYLISALGTNDLFTKVCVTEGLGLCGASAAPAIPVLLSNLSDPDSNFRFVTVNTLQQIGKPALPALSQMMSNTQGVARLACSRAIAGIYPSLRGLQAPFREMIATGDAVAREQGVKSLGNAHPLDPESRETLNHALADTDASIRRAASNALANAGLSSNLPLKKTGGS